MMLCVSIHETGGVQYVALQSPQPADVTACPLVLAAPAEIGANPFALSTSEAVQIGTAILSVWAIAWVFRAILRFLQSSMESNDA